MIHLFDNIMAFNLVPKVVFLLQGSFLFCFLFSSNSCLVNLPLFFSVSSARGAHKRSGDLQHRLHQHVLFGDDPQDHRIRLL